MNVVVDGLMVNYQKAGNGEKVLLMLHGWGDASQTFSQLIEKLQDDYLIYTLDLPGFGGTQAPPEAWGLEDYAAFLKHWQKKLAIADLYAVIGHSFGGAVATTLLGNNYAKSKKLILLASAGIRDDVSLRRSLLTAVSKVGKIPLYLLPPSKAQRIKQKFYGRIGSDVLVNPGLRSSFIKMIKEDTRKYAVSIKIPTLLINASQDKEIPLRHGELLHGAIKNSRLVTIEAGHFLHQEKAEEVARLIKNFLEDRDV